MCNCISICRFRSLARGRADLRTGGIRSLTICSARDSETVGRTRVRVTRVGHYCAKCVAGGRWLALQVLAMDVDGVASMGSMLMWPTTCDGSRPR